MKIGLNTSEHFFQSTMLAWIKKLYRIQRMGIGRTECISSAVWAVTAIAVVEVTAIIEECDHPAIHVYCHQSTVNLVPACAGDSPH
jgi:hypothetical protein